MNPRNKRYLNNTETINVAKNEESLRSDQVQRYVKQLIINPINDKLQHKLQKKLYGNLIEVISGYSSQERKINKVW